jgi:prepilin-type processing-associated H-X9-DG protein
VRIAEIRDGTSHTIAIGETQFDYELIGGQRLDHWYIGSPEVDGWPHVSADDFSEFLGSTAAPLNCQGDMNYPRDMQELAFGSYHSGVAHVLFCDGAVNGVSETVESSVWSAYGTRDGGEVNP